MASEAPTEGLTSPPARVSRPWMRNGWIAAKVACVIAALVHPVASLLSRVSWLADLLSHFQEPALAATLLAFGLTVARHRKLAGALLVLAIFQMSPLLRYSGSNPVPPEPGSPSPVRILLANVLFENERYGEIVDLIRAERPDVIGIVEYSAGWREALAPFRDEYPYRTEVAADASGMALWFRKPPKSLDPPEWLVSWMNPIVHATFDFAGKERHLWLVHPTSPFYRIGSPGNKEMERIANRVRATAGSRIVMGDMNSTDGSAHFRDFLKNTGLRDSRLGFGRQGSWPTDMPYRIAIDHVFVTDDLSVVARRLGQVSGSDHFPVVIDLAPAAARKPETKAAQSSASSL